MKKEETSKLRVCEFDVFVHVYLTSQTGTFDHPYPATKIMWHPSRVSAGPDLLGTTGDYLRIWEVQQDHNSVELKHLFNNVSFSLCCSR